MKRLFHVCKTSPPWRTSLHTSSIDTYPQHHYPKPEHYHYISRILARDDWFLLLRHEHKAKIFPLHSRFIISILQTLDSSLLSLRFYLWATNTESLLSKDRSINRALGSILCRLGPLVLSPVLLNDLRNAGYSINTDLLCLLIASWGRLGLVKYCDEVFGQISFLNIAPSTMLYNAIIQALVNSNCIDMAYLKFHQMPSDNCKPDRFTYNVLIHGVCKAGITDEAVRLVSAMEGAGYLSNVFTYTILIQGFCKQRKLNEACEVLETMKSRNVKPNEATVRTFVTGAFRSASPKEARGFLFKHFKKGDCFYDLACGTAVTFLAGTGMGKEAFDFMKEVMRNGYVPNSSVANVTVLSLLNDVGLKEACELVDMLIERHVGVGLGTLVRVVEPLYRSGRVSEADRYVGYMEEKGELRNVYCYNALIDCLCKGKVMNRATASFHEMMEKGISPDVVTLNTLITGHCKGGDLEEAKKLLKFLLENRLKPDVYTFSSLIDGLCKGNRVGDALGCLREMKGWGVAGNAVTYNTVTRGLCLLGEVNKAAKLMRRMKKEGVKQDVHGFNALIECLCKMGKIEKATRVFERMTRENVAPDGFTYGAFIKSLCKMGRIEEAKNLFWSMEERGCCPDSFLCNFLLMFLVKWKRLEDAGSVLHLCKRKGIRLSIT